VRRLILGLALVAGPAMAEDGQQLYAHNCAACHMTDGKGIPGAFPALSANPFATGPDGAVAATLLNGRGGMPSFRSGLTDAEIAAVLSYVRSNWGNTAPPVTPETVAAARSGAEAEKARPIPAH
jgi:cytochrome c6